MYRANLDFRFSKQYTGILTPRTRTHSSDEQKVTEDVGKVYLTAEGAEELQHELDRLIEVRRPELAEKLTEAVAQGDLKENADYHDAKEQLAFVEGRIGHLENVLRSAEIISNGGGQTWLRWVPA